MPPPMSICLRARLLRGLMVHVMGGGIARAMPVGTFVVLFGGSDTVLMLLISYPTEPIVARVGGVALGWMSWTWTLGWLATKFDLVVEYGCDFAEKATGDVLSLAGEIGNS